MKNLKEVDTVALVDMLSVHTDEYLRMLKEGTTEEAFAACKDMIGHLLAEIESRKQSSGGRLGADQSINFKKREE